MRVRVYGIEDGGTDVSSCLGEDISVKAGTGRSRIGSTPMTMTFLSGWDMTAESISMLDRYQGKQSEVIAVGYP